jgi:Kef-type K+ transport system membrane component KefB
VHHDPIVTVALHLAVILLAAKLGGHLAVRLGQPSVLGELFAGVVLGNLTHLGFGGFEAIKHSEAIAIFASLGVLILLFEVGLESTIRQMLSVGFVSLVVATVGVVAPFLLGWGVGAWLLPDQSVYVHVFLGATLCATSVGITARVLRDLNRSDTEEARIILGAAVIDDVLGLIVLAVVTGIISAAGTGESVGYGAIGTLIAKAVLFLAVALFIGSKSAARVLRLASGLRADGVLLALGLAFCLLMAWLAALVGLAPIVGAFAAGLILEDVHYQEFRQRGEHGLEELIHPISAFLVPVFFVLMGLHTDLAAFVQPGVPLLALVLTIAAVIGKQVCGLGVMRRGLNRVAIGIGMVPRGEVGLIFANVGLGLVVAGERIVSPAVYSAVVVMVMVTTLVTPPALKWAFGRRESRPRAPAQS